MEDFDPSQHRYGQLDDNSRRSSGHEGHRWHRWPLECEGPGARWRIRLPIRPALQGQVPVGIAGCVQPDLSTLSDAADHHAGAGWRQDMTDATPQINGDLRKAA